MTKGYWMVHVEVENAEAFKAYITAVMDVFAKYGARYLARGGQFEAVEGRERPRNTIVEFPSYQVAVDCWHSPEYQAVKALRENAGRVDITIVEGYEGLQPGS
ncbi:hypothetical protein GCM10011613_19320 [Cellvibrio zantedeschiae]|uniref:DUF1330 domain-containing protein n=1 Tax=Cellvibrio zantedeschiae TaxID=1237077 RepID=A0ABQ3B517_9GAMM|nr:DUF1330 domain-containing protein [Cellvibrio zantedeschiae]GGY74113.1 hypothetical protein GCM10011613_19320 [Cellvibrio zantedeschiae]